MSRKFDRDMACIIFTDERDESQEIWVDMDIADECESQAELCYLLQDKGFVPADMKPSDINASISVRYYHHE